MTRPMCDKTFARGIAVLSILAIAGPVSARSPGRPNVVVILADDLGVHDLGIEGSTFHETPRIDALARSGIRYTCGYATSSVCSPTRASLQLGQFASRHGITNWIGSPASWQYDRDDPLLPADYRRQLSADDTTIAQALGDAGYHTFFAGKWHLGGQGSLPTDHGYDINIGGHHAGTPPGGFFSPYQNPYLSDGPDGESLTLRLAKETAGFIDQNKDRPFFAMLSFYAVHAPAQTTQPLWQKYQRKAAADPHVGDRFIIDRTLPVRQVQDNPVYAGMVQTLDDAVGVVIDAIDAAGLSDSTLIIFTSDNGGVSSGDHHATSNLPLRGGKGRQWEGGVREPFYLRYPPLTRPGATSPVPVTTADLYPTILEVCDVPSPPHVIDGISLVPTFAGRSLPERSLYWHDPHYDNQGGQPSSIIRSGDFKLIHYYEDGHDELYDLQADPGERSDLAADQPERAAAMRTELIDHLTSVNALLPSPDPRYDPAKNAAKWARIHGPGKQALERQHAAMLQPDWQPDPTWWGSRPKQDRPAR